MDNITKYQMVEHLINGLSGINRKMKELEKIGVDVSKAFDDQLIELDNALKLLLPNGYAGWLEYNYDFIC